MTTKQCNECNETLSLKYFTPHTVSRGGYLHQCKFCRSSLQRLSPDELIARKEERKNAKKERKKEKLAEQKEKARERYLLNKENRSEYQKQYNANMTEEQKRLRRQKWQEYKRKRKESDPVFHVSENLRSRLAMAFKAKGWKKPCKTQDMVGCDYRELRDHLISSALNRYGFWSDVEKYEIDHIIPISIAKTEDDLVKLNHFSNLQFLTPHDNAVKGDRL